MKTLQLQQATCRPLLLANKNKFRRPASVNIRTGSRSGDGQRPLCRASRRPIESNRYETHSLTSTTSSTIRTVSSTQLCPVHCASPWRCLIRALLSSKREDKLTGSTRECYIASSVFVSQSGSSEPSSSIHRGESFIHRNPALNSLTSLTSLLYYITSGCTRTACPSARLIRLRPMPHR